METRRDQISRTQSQSSDGKANIITNNSLTKGEESRADEAYNKFLAEFGSFCRRAQFLFVDLPHVLDGSCQRLSLANSLNTVTVCDANMVLVLPENRKSWRELLAFVRWAEDKSPCTTPVKPKYWIMLYSTVTI